MQFLVASAPTTSPLGFGSSIGNMSSSFQVTALGSPSHIVINKIQEINAALAEIDSLEPGEDFSYSKLAEKYGVSRITLARRHQGLQVPRGEANSNQAKLNPQQEIELVKHYANSEAKYNLYFNLLQHTIAKYNITLRHTYNMDEKGFAIGVLTRSLRIFSRALWAKKKVRQLLQDGNCEWVAEIDPETEPIYATLSPSGWTNNEIGLSWLKQVFDRYTKAKARQSYRLLIVDGHGSHLTREFIEYCHKNRIILAILPPHSTQTLQPLDVVCFKPLSTNYSNELSNYIQASQGLSPIGKYEFLHLFWPAWVNTFTETLVLSGFRATGISPPNADVILDRFRRTSHSPSVSISSGSTAYNSNDWLKACSLLRAEVKDPRSRGARKLGQTIHHLSIQNELLNDEVLGLKRTLNLQKKKKQQPNKELQLPRDETHGGAMMWSPRTFRDAQARMAQEAEELRAENLKKAEMKELKAANKRYNDMIAQQKREQRLREKEERDRLKAVKAAEVAERKAEKERQKQLLDAEKSIQLPKQVKRKLPPAAGPRKKQNRGGVGGGSQPIVHEPSPSPPPKLGRNNRKIALPKRFQ
ncbi:hypothetical protein OPT61_g1348 [Boeremia exigua]|uniref:Uncharacterized protein n=1 Tax=Boeremia exigua TaxID=749465 RepID=A0ACC2IQN3_9PLEO|nr:hypothetical protein OPT61_g1348 [Boeremia exigua]